MDENVEAVRQMLSERAERGLLKYGVTTERSDLVLVDWLRHLQEELLDGAVYIEAAIKTVVDSCPECMKPLFVPLRTKWFEQYKAGEKTSELRMYGPRWNENTCVVGRRVVLSKGYGKTDRLGGHIVGFHKRQGQTFGSTNRAAILEEFGTDDVPVAEIRIQLNRVAESGA